MYKIISVLFLILVSCDDDVSNVKPKDKQSEQDSVIRHGWKELDPIIFLEDRVRFLSIISVDKNSVYFLADDGVFVNKEYRIYKKTDTLDLELVSVIQSRFFINSGPFIVSFGDKTMLSSNRGYNWHEINDLKILDAQNLNGDLILLTESLGLVKLNKDMKSYTIIDSSFLSTLIVDGEEIKRCNYKTFEIFDNYNTVLIDFENKEVVKFTDNFKKKSVYKQGQLFDIVSNYEVTNEIFKDKLSIPSDRAIYVIESNGLYKSLTTGDDWKYLYHITDINFDKIFGVNDDKVYILDRSKLEENLHYSSDGGDDFTSLELPKGFKVKDFMLYDDRIIYCVGSSNRIFKATNGGL